jgi:hypothetical protein
VANEQTSNRTMTRIMRRLVDALSMTLDPDERDAVQGDLMESQASAAAELREVLGLVLRRQSALWADWRPWLCLSGVVVPIGALLSHASRWWADGSAIYAFLYVNNWTWYYLGSPGARQDLITISANIFLEYGTLVCWAWTSGFVLGSISRRTLLVTGPMFCVAILAGAAGSGTNARSNPFNEAVFSLWFYDKVFPSMVCAVLVLLPAIQGIRRSRRELPLSLGSTAFVVAATALLTAWSSKALEGSVLFAQGLIRPNPGLDHVLGTADDPRPLRFLSLVMVWPAAYMLTLAIARGRHWRQGPLARQMRRGGQ